MEPSPRATDAFLDLYIKTLRSSPFRIGANVRFKFDYLDHHGGVIAPAGTPGEVLYEHPECHGWYDIFTKMKARVVRFVPAIALVHETDWPA